MNSTAQHETTIIAALTLHTHFHVCHFFVIQTEMNVPMEISNSNEVIVALDDSLKRNNESIDNNDNKQKRMRFSTISEEFNKSISCPICKEIPSGRIFQCCNGHIICKEPCLANLLDSNKSLCPLCRESWHENKPVRNIIGESMIQLLSIPCPNNGCDEFFNAKDLILHRDQSCQFRIVDCCKFQMLGCEKTSVAFREMFLHESKECECKVDDASFALFRVVLDEKNQQVKKLTERLKITEQNQQLIQQKYMEADERIQTEIRIDRMFFRNPATKDSEMRNVYFTKVFPFPENASSFIAYAPLTFTAVGVLWNVKLILILKLEGSAKVLENLYLSLSVAPRHRGSCNTNCINVGISKLNDDPAQLSFGAIYDTGLVKWNPVEEDQQIIFDSIVSRDIEGIIPWSQHERQYTRFYDIGKYLNNTADVIALWKSQSLIPALRLIFVNNSLNLKATTKFSSRKKKKSFL
jgi:hypothetical protein